jgi:hypothetical protein
LPPITIIMRSSLLVLSRAIVRRPLLTTTTSGSSSSSSRCSLSSMQDFFNPTEDHRQLRSMLRDFVQREVRRNQSCILIYTY